jgi:UDP-N-acetylmuramate--alanine ligase
MSPIAKLLAACGHTVSGSDTRASAVTEQLQELGVDISIGHHPDLVTGVDVVVYSTAIPSNNVELVAARTQGIPVRHRSGILSSLCAVSRAIGVAGTHGKTTTTALLSTIFATSHIDASVIIGAEVPGHGVGAYAGSSDVLLLEADESDGTLDVLPLESIVITNVDVDHLDYFGSFEEMQTAFVDAARRCTGVVVANADDPQSEPIRAAFQDSSRLVTFGWSMGATIRLVDVQPTDNGLLVVLEANGVQHKCQLPLRGRHNAANLAAAIALSMSLGVDVANACRAVETFTGVARRFTERGSFGGAQLIDDYAHLPAEISAAIAAARSHPKLNGQLVAVFQPNRFHRIAALADTYADCFSEADTIIITDVYASGTEPIPGVTGKMVSDAIIRAHPDSHVVWAPTREDIITTLRATLQSGDVCLSMGCGDIERLPTELCESGE